MTIKLDNFDTLIRVIPEMPNDTIIRINKISVFRKSDIIQINKSILFNNVFCIDYKHIANSDLKCSISSLNAHEIEMEF